MNQNVLIAKEIIHGMTCPKWKEEKEIQRIKAERGISYTEAKKQMDIFNSVKTTYAQQLQQPNLC